MPRWSMRLQKRPGHRGPRLLSWESLQCAACLQPASRLWLPVHLASVPVLPLLFPFSPYFPPSFPLWQAHRSDACSALGLLVPSALHSDTAYAASPTTCLRLAVCMQLACMACLVAQPTLDCLIRLLWLTACPSIAGASRSPPPSSSYMPSQRMEQARQALTLMMDTFTDMLPAASHTVGPPPAGQDHRDAQRPRKRLRVAETVHELRLLAGLPDESSAAALPTKEPTAAVDQVDGDHSRGPSLKTGMHLMLAGAGAKENLILLMSPADAQAACSRAKCPCSIHVVCLASSVIKHM